MNEQQTIGRTIPVGAFATTIVRGHWQGVIGTFIRDESGPISPILDSLADLYPWMRANGWAIADYDERGAFVPWRVRKIA